METSLGHFFYSEWIHRWSKKPYKQQGNFWTSTQNANNVKLSVLKDIIKAESEVINNGSANKCCLFQLVLISWMVTLFSCLIWQIISFILPLNEYDCVYLNNTGKYCDITLKILVMLQYVCENCIRILKEAPSALKKVKETGILFNKSKPKTVRIPENIAAVTESVREAPSTSIYHCSQQLNISVTSLRRILHKDLYMTKYKVQLVQEWQPIDHPMRFRFAKWACDWLTEDADFGKKKSSLQVKLILILAGM